MAVLVVIMLASVFVAQISVVGQPLGTSDDSSGVGQAGADGIQSTPVAPPGDSGDDAELWSANVGTSSFTGLDGDNVGDVLFRGDTTPYTFVDRDGNEQTVQLCSDIPDVSVSRDFNPVDDSFGGMNLILDLKACTISISKVEYGRVNELADDTTNPGPIGLLPEYWQSFPSVKSVPIVYIPDHFEPFQNKDQPVLPGPVEELSIYLLGGAFGCEEADTVPDRTSSRSRVDVTISAEAQDRVNCYLSRTEARLVYNPSNLNTSTSSRVNCLVNSPLDRIASITWHRDSCSRGSVVRRSDHVFLSGTGRYHANAPAGRLSGDSRHSSTVEVRGYRLASSSSSVRIHGTCSWSPREIDDLAIRLPGYTTGYDVVLICADRS